MNINKDETKHLKIIFDIDDSENPDIESLWATPVGKNYEIDSIPFYVRSVACGDMVSAVPDEEGALRFSGLVSASGHSTIRLWFAKEEDVLKTRNELRVMGCPSELDLPRLVAVDVPPSVPYGEVRSYLDGKENAGVFEYEEACLGQEE
ncbi:DUF4265 domain-containing protein [Luteimonas fraxinea]|uniref:DUF4265 domain-containing protein n=1 Tax=Luteimonas fraxinea TaxID=2901869 RepID=UPI001E2C39F7|nr:DUF4265 domain-containing protein [Luteimonas fraxinea]MCD9127672.1 DUF4265 domain-containing protein [Luteimonas fraxinea]